MRERREPIPGDQVGLDGMIRVMRDGNWWWEDPPYTDVELLEKKVELMRVWVEAEVDALIDRINHLHHPR